MQDAQTSTGAARRVPGRPFKKGQSGNPGGQPKGLVTAIRERTKDGATLVAFMLRVFEGKVKRATLNHRMEAATWLSDRGFGRPQQSVHNTGEMVQRVEFVGDESNGNDDPS